MKVLKRARDLQFLFARKFASENKNSMEPTILLLAVFIIPNNTFLSRAIESPWKFSYFPPLLPPPSLTVVDLGLTVDECKRLIDVLVAVCSSVLVFVWIDFVFVWIF